MSDAGRKYASDGARNKQLFKSSLTSSSKKMARSVTWADESIDDGTGKKSSSKILEYENQVCGGSGSTDMEEDGDSYHFESAEAFAAALSLAAEAVASGSDVPDAVSKAGIIILPPPQEINEAIHQENDEILDIEPAPLKWPRKPGMPNYDVFESEDSPPEGFNMTGGLIFFSCHLSPQCLIPSSHGYNHRHWHLYMGAMKAVMRSICLSMEENILTKLCYPMAGRLRSKRLLLPVLLEHYRDWLLTLGCLYQYQL